MVKNKLVIIWIVVLLAAQVNAFTTNGTGKTFDFTITSGKNAAAEGTSYKTYTVVGQPTGAITSSNFKMSVGSLITLPFLNGEACEVNAECIGGFCCSNVCQSTSCPVAAAGGGGAAAPAAGGGAGFSTPKKEFSLSKNTIKAELALGEEKSESLIITNTGETSLDFSLSTDGEIKEFLILSETAFNLAAGESKIIGLDFIGKRVGSFTGSVAVKGNGIGKKIAISVEVESKVVLFDVKIETPPEYRMVKAGEELKSQITLFSLGVPEKVDVTINYFIKDLEGNIVLQETETLSIEGQLSFMKSFQLPKGLVPGIYTVSVEVIYANSFAVSSEFFEVIEEIEEKEFEAARYLTKISYIILIVLIFFFLVILAYLIGRSRHTALERLYRRFQRLLVKINSRIEANKHKKAAKLYRRLYLDYNELLKYPFENKIKADMHKKIRQIYDKLQKIKDDYKKRR